MRQQSSQAALPPPLRILQSISPPRHEKRWPVANLAGSILCWTAGCSMGNVRRSLNCQHVWGHIHQGINDWQRVELHWPILMWTSPSMVNSRLLILRQCVHEHNLIDAKEKSPEKRQCVGGQICLTNNSWRECLEVRNIKCSLTIVWHERSTS